MTIEERNRLLEENIPSIVHAVNKIKAVLKYKINGMTEEDIFQLGAIEALRAIEDYIPSETISLAQYLRYIVYFRLIDTLRTNVLFSRVNRFWLKRITNTKYELTQTLHRFPYPDEIAKAMHVSLKRYYKLERKATRHQILSLDAPIKLTQYLGNPIIIQQPHSEPSILEILEDQELLSALNAALDKLDPRDKYILKELYFNAKDAKNIATSLDLHESRISQLRRRALKNVRKYLKEYYENPNSSYIQ